uniref:Pectinesterase n=2 Tax=Aegilops tauschii subsp. strangulata TaxID=200361 RepID=A0A453A5E4_AEGTS
AHPIPPSTHCLPTATTTTRARERLPAMSPRTTFTLQLLLVLVVVGLALAATTTAAPAVLGGGKHHRGVLSTPVRRLKPDVRVSKLGGGGAGAGAVTVTSVGEALSLWKNLTGAHFVIYVTAGTYEEHITVPEGRNNVVLIGDGVGRTIITGALSDRTGHNVMQSATMSVFAKGFMARDVTIQNTAGGPGINQAVALRVQADRTVFYRCQIHGYQDTLMAESHLQFYRECEISGTVDFIFGDATAVFQDCIVFARRPADGKHDVITAQGRGAHLGGSGFVLQNCSITTAPGESLNGVQTYLGRPWNDHATVVYMLCTIDDIIHADGWVAWNKTNPKERVKGGVMPGHEGHIFYGEFANHGAGANVDHRVDWHGFHRLNEAQARLYAPGRFIQGGAWLPQTGVPHYLGLRDGE